MNIKKAKTQANKQTKRAFSNNALFYYNLIILFS